MWHQEQLAFTPRAPLQPQAPDNHQATVSVGAPVLGVSHPWVPQHVVLCGRPPSLSILRSRVIVARPVPHTPGLLWAEPYSVRTHTSFCAPTPQLLDVGVVSPFVAAVNICARELRGSGFHFSGAHVWEWRAGSRAASVANCSEDPPTCGPRWLHRERPCTSLLDGITSQLLNCPSLAGSAVPSLTHGSLAVGPRGRGFAAGHPGEPHPAALHRCV